MANMNVYQLLIFMVRIESRRVRVDYNLYIQVQSPLSEFSLNCVIKETRPLFFYSRILDSSVTRLCWAGRLKSNSFLQPRLLPAL